MWRTQDWERIKEEDVETESGVWFAVINKIIGAYDARF